MKSMFTGAAFVIGMLLATLGVIALYHITAQQIAAQDNDNFIEQVEQIIQDSPSLEVRKTDEQIVVEPGSEVRNMLVIYKGSQSPILIKEENAVCRTGVEVKAVTPNEIQTFISQY